MYKQTKPSSHEHLILAAGNKDTVKTLAFTALCKHILQELVSNVDFYKDLAAFNFGDKQTDPQTYKYILFHNLPPEIDLEVSKMYRVFKEGGISKIYEILNIPRLETIQNCPLEAKWVFHYVERYKTTEWSIENHIDKKLILTPLTAQQRVSFEKQLR